jgi:hypothetical protein
MHTPIGEDSHHGPVNPCQLIQKCGRDNLLVRDDNLTEATIAAIHSW